MEIWLDYTGEIVLCNVDSADENGFRRMEKLAGYVGAGTEVYYLKENTSDGKYYAYKTPADDAEPALFSKTMIGNMAEDSSKLINNIALKDALKVNYYTDPLPHKILFSLAYGTEGLDYIVNKPNPADHSTWTIEMINGAQPRTIADLRERGNDIINDVAISDIMGADPKDALGMYLLYGKKGIHYELDADDNITLLPKYIAISDDNTCVYNEYGELLSPLTGTSNGYVLDTTNQTYTDALGYTYKYSTPDPVKTLNTNDGKEGVKVYYLTDENGNAVNFTAHSLGELAGSDNLISRLTDRLTLAEILGEDSLKDNKFLKHLKDSTVNGLPKAISELTIGQVFEEEIYVTCQVYHGTPVASAELDNHGNPIMINDGDWYYEDSNGKLHPSEGERAIRGTWKYLLKTKDEYGHVIYKTDYLVAQDMNSLLTNMTENVKTATLYEMNNDGVMAFEYSMMTQPVEDFKEYGLPTDKQAIIDQKLADADISKAKYPTLGAMSTTKVLSYLNIVLEVTMFLKPSMP
jgi:hypothetical protein